MHIVYSWEVVPHPPNSSHLAPSQAATVWGLGRLHEVLSPWECCNSPVSCVSVVTECQNGHNLQQHVSSTYRASKNVWVTMVILWKSNRTSHVTDENISFIHRPVY